MSISRATGGPVQPRKLFFSLRSDWIRPEQCSNLNGCLPQPEISTIYGALCSYALECGWDVPKSAVLD